MANPRRLRSWWEGSFQSAVVKHQSIHGSPEDSGMGSVFPPKSIRQTIKKLGLNHRKKKVAVSNSEE